MRKALVPADSKLFTFLDKHQIQLSKHDENSFGSYVVIMSFDRVAWFVPGRRFGWGYTERQAAVETLWDLALQPTPDSTLVQWLGIDRINEMVEIVKYESTQNEPPVPIQGIRDEEGAEGLSGMPTADGNRGGDRGSPNDFLSPTSEASDVVGEKE